MRTKSNGKPSTTATRTGFSPMGSLFILLTVKIVRTDSPTYTARKIEITALAGRQVDPTPDGESDSHKTRDTEDLSGSEADITLNDSVPPVPS